jgi:methylated-DNA-protein-cysteine methyltransferase related protein
MTKKSPSVFYQKVWQLALQIPEGKVTTYGLLCAAAGGHPMMSRMITTILSKSPDVDKIPFHRIVYSNSKIWLDSTKSSDEGGRDKLYKKEGIKVDRNNKIINFDKIIYTF